MRFLLIAGLLGLLVAVLTGCPNGERSRPTATTGDTPAEHTHQAGLELSLFRDTPMLSNPPDAVSFSRDGNLLWVRGLDRSSQQFYASQLEVGDKALTPKFHTEAPDLIVNYAQASPVGDECLVLSQYQPQGGGPVRDVVYRVGDKFGEDLKWRSMVPWESIAGIPAVTEELFAFTTPFYSWDGATILIPFKGRTGVAVVDKRTGAGRFAPYPKTAIPVWNGSLMGTLPDEDGSRRVWASFWAQGSPDDQCEVYTLDLDSLKWEKAFELTWIAYICAAEQPSVMPWLVWGSYNPLLDRDAKISPNRPAGTLNPRLGLVVPGAGTQDLLTGYGEPVWQIALDPLGKYGFFADLDLNALVRFNPANGKKDIDPRWSSKDADSAHLFISSGGERCFIWERDILIEADWQQHEDLQGYDE